MNHHPRHPELSPTTQAAEGLARRRWSVAEIDDMVAKGIFAEDERFELIGGEIVPMQSKGARHEAAKIALNRFFQRKAPDTLEVAQATTLRLDTDTFVEPDFCVFARGLDLKALHGSAVLLAVEIADSSLAYDLGRKIGIYAAYGVPEVWVVNANTLVTRIHRDLGAQGYALKRNIPHRQLITPALATELAVRLADLHLKPA